MSSGKQNPLGVNVTGSLLQNIGLSINATTSALTGISTSVTDYTPGTVITATCLNKLTQAIQAGYLGLGTAINTTTYGNLISIGATTIPALGNAKPSTYNWIGPANSCDSTSEASQAISWYPYAATDTTNTYPLSNPTPRQWSTLTQTTYNANITQWGWVRLFALQAYNEFNYNGNSTSTPVYKDFLSSFTTAAGFIKTNNATINASSQGDTFLKNTYSNLDDLISADITGVNKATLAFGQDLIATGKAIDLSSIDTFGLPSNLFKTLRKYKAITSSLLYAVIASGIQSNEFDSFISGATEPTKLQEQQLYGALTVITGADLADILIPLNCTTKGLTTLADLLDPIKLFPNSYSSLTVPIYNANPGPTNAKTYYLVYTGTGINSQISSPQVVNEIGTVAIAPVSTRAPGLGTNFQMQPIGFGAYSRDIIPDNVSIAAGAFSFAMQQIKNIKNVPIEKFAQVVANIETTKNLTLVTGTDIPTNSELANGGLDQSAYGSGPNGSFTVSDFFGCMSGLPYAWNDIQQIITQLQTTTLSNLYQQIYTTISTASGSVDAAVQALIDSANAEILSIYNKNSALATTLNKLWNATGTQLTIEQRARDMAFSPVPVPKDNRMYSYPMSITTFVDSVPDYAHKTEPHMFAQTLEAISDLTTPGGQSLVALMRRCRNKTKLNLVGIPLDDEIPADQNQLTQKILMGNGTVSTGRPNQGIPASPATFTIPADASVLNAVEPLGHFETGNNGYCVPTKMNTANVLGTIPDTASVGQDLAGPNITQVANPITPVSGGFLPEGACNILNTGKPTAPGSLAGSPYQSLIPIQLSIPYTSGLLSSPKYSVSEAIDEVVRCNCDCWLD